MRRNAAEVLPVAKTQRRTPEDVLPTLVEAEISARDASNTANRLKAAAFPVSKTLDGFNVAGSSVSQATFDYLSSLEWIRAQQNLAVIGPPGTGKKPHTHRLRSRRGSRCVTSPPPTSSRFSTGA